MKTMTKASLLLALAVCATSASASYFFNSQWGTMLNVGSAPNPTPDQLRAIGDSKYGNTAANPRRDSSGVRRENFVTADLNRASLLSARAAASKATAIKAAKAVAPNPGTANTAGTTKSRAPAKAGSYFVNSQWGTRLNVGSAPNPTPDQLRAIGNSKYVSTAANPRRDSSPLHNSPVLRGSRIPSVMAADTFVETKAGARQEFVTADLNRASLLSARAVASKATAIEAAKAAAPKTGTAKTASTSKAASKSGAR